MITSEHFPFLDFWFYKVGVNVRPADTRDKKVSRAWAKHQTIAMTPEEYEEMKKAGDFTRGAAIITGRVWRGDHVGLYLNGIDLDNSKAIEEICDHKVNGKVVTLQELAKMTLLEQHPDAPGKLHMYVYSRHPFKNKSSDAGRAWFNKETMPAIEVKGTKCLMFCTPSMHEDRHRYQFINHRLPTISDDLERIINDILSTYGIDYLSKDDKRGRDTQEKNDKSRVINEGSRHTELLREMNAQLHDFIRTKPLEEIKQICIKFNNLYCRPPLDTNEFEKMWNDSVIHVTEQELEKEAGGSSISAEAISVAEAIRRSSGKVVVKGMVIGLSSVIQVVTQTEFVCSNCGTSNSVFHNPPLFALPYFLSLANKSKRCDSCAEPASYGPSKHQNKSSMIIQLQDEEKQNELESLNVVLFGDQTVNVRNGEKAMIMGDLHVVQQRGNSKRVTYLFANGIEYEKTSNENIVITEEDLSRLDEFSHQSDAVTSLVKMLAPTVIGHEDKKLGILLMYIGAPATEDFRRRIHGLFIGPPGTAKSKLAHSAKKLGQPHSRYSSTQGASGKSITAIIDKDNDSYVLRLGVLPQAKNSICVLNEIASLSMEEQRHLFDVMEEGKLTLDKYGFHKEIDSPTTVLSTTNPQSGEWYDNVLDKGQIPLRKELVDRYDLIFTFESLKDKNQKIDYAKKKLAILKDREIKEDHEFLRKVIEHAKSFNPELTEEAEAMIIDYWSGLDTKIFPTNRVLETILRVSFSFARLHFSNLVTSEIAKEAMNFLTKMYRAFDRNVVLVQDPRDATCQEIVKFLTQNPNMPYEFQDCINYAASNNTLIEAYVGKTPVDNNSSKYRDIAERFKQGLVGEGLIAIEYLHPLTLVYRKNDDTDNHDNTTTSSRINSHNENKTDSVPSKSIPPLLSTASNTSSSSAKQSTPDNDVIDDVKVPMSTCSNREFETAEDSHSRRPQCNRGDEGLPEIPCIFCCRYKTPIEFDLALHLQGSHRMDLVKLVLGKGYSIEDRADYAIELGKRKIAYNLDIARTSPS
jgi:DNA replicative helicase MCM subunit Mcm2 (Cdc46/Mcm family)